MYVNLFIIDFKFFLFINSIVNDYNKNYNINYLVNSLLMPKIIAPKRTSKLVTV
jgi:hypothetical protein